MVELYRFQCFYVKDLVSLINRLTYPLEELDVIVYYWV